MHERETTAIPKLVLSTTLRVLRRIVVDRARMSIGRRPYNDIMLDDLTVSGEHAVLHTGAGECVIHDLHSRNGTLVNGLPVMQRVLVDGDRIEIGIYRLDFVIERVVADPVAADRADGLSAGSQSGTAGLRVLSGSNAGATLALDRPIVSIGNGAGQVAVLARRRNGHYVTHLEGPAYPLVNGESIGLVAHPLRHDDLIELAGTIFQFFTEAPS
jgi:pSer/pThr/pTyr-binding forkhead associated (FHA) protein